MKMKLLFDTKRLNKGFSVSLWKCVDLIKETKSTNTELLTKAASGVNIEGYVLLANYQNSGRGQNGKVWITHPSSQITISFGIDISSISTNHWGWLPLISGLAVIDTLREITGVKFRLKWPNDVLGGSNNEKLAGILTEVSISSSTIVIGIGINVSIAPKEMLGLKATSLKQLGSELLDRIIIVQKLLYKMHVWINLWKDSNPSIIKYYTRYSITIGSLVCVTLKNKSKLVGEAIGLDKSGGLIINTKDSKVTVFSGSVKHLRLNKLF